MKGDFTRRTFHGANHYRGVLLQQGRVALDADWNEQVEIQQHHDETTARDVIGAGGGPKSGAGFGIVGPGGGVPRACPAGDLWLTAGRYYVEGVLCENEEPIRLAAQPDLPGVPLPDADGRYAAYLDVWHEHLTAVERPELREVALGGPDTATRSRTVWQVRLAQVPGTSTSAEVAASWSPDGERTTGRLRARAQAPDASSSPCLIPPSAGYRRLENQLYRVEVRDQPTGPAYVWSRDNGAVAARLATVDGDVLTLDASGREPSVFAKGDLVEVIDLDGTRRGELGALGHLTEISAATLTVAWAGDRPPDRLADPKLVRRWDCAEASPITGDWVDLEDGVQIQFDTDARYRNGDHWLIPARTALSGTDLDADLAGDVEWPVDAGGPAFRPPEGIEHRTALVALLDLAGGGWSLVSDCRRLFTPLADIPETPVPPPTLHVEGVLLRAPGSELSNGGGARLDDFLGGFTIRLDGTPPAGLAGTPVLVLTLDLPYPLLPSDRSDVRLPDDSAVVLGTRPLDLAGVISIDGRDLVWELPSEARAGVESLLNIANRVVDRVRCRLTVNGYAAVDGVPVTDFAMWFWVAVSDLDGKFDDSTFDRNVFV
jgi:hypothetical protein